MDIRHTEETERTSYAPVAPDLIKALYRGILGREADEGGLKTWTRKLAENGNLGEVLAGFFGSPEYRRRSLDALSPELVNAAFKAVLRRTPKPEGLHASISRLKKDHDIAGLFDRLIGSEEFRQAFARRDTLEYPAPGDLRATKTIFLHIPKTGGVTLHDALTPCFEARQVCPERFDGLHRYSARELASYRLFSGHFTLEGCEFIPGPRRIVTMLRHPVDLLISYYNFARSHSDKVIEERRSWLFSIARRHSIREFFSLDEVRYHPHINNTMVKRLTAWFPAARWDSREIRDDSDALGLLPLAKERLRSLAAVGILERYQESAELIFHALGLPLPATIEPKNVLKDLPEKYPWFEKIEPQACDEETRELIAPLVEADLALYNYGRELFEERIAMARSNLPAAL